MTLRVATISYRSLVWACGWPERIIGTRHMMARTRTPNVAVVCLAFVTQSPIRFHRPVARMSIETVCRPNARE